MGQNRAARRQAMRATASRNRERLEDWTQQQRLEALYQNGITAKDVEEVYHEGFVIGGNEMVIRTTRALYAIMCVVLSERGASQDECWQTIAEMDKRLLTYIDQDELAQEVLEKTGIELEFEEAIDRVRRVKV